VLSHETISLGSRLGLEALRDNKGRRCRDYIAELDGSHSALVQTLVYALGSRIALSYSETNTSFAVPELVPR
jgi:hypothetical protein